MSPPIGFNEISSNVRVPLFYSEFDNSRASTSGTSGLEALLIGQKRSDGTASAAVPVQVTSVDQAKALFGNGSMLTRMVEKYFLNNNGRNPLTCLPLDDASGGAGATFRVILNGTASASGDLVMRAGGRRYSVPVASGDAAATIRAAFETLVDGDEDRVFNAAIQANNLNLTYRNDGVVGNSASVEIGYFDDEDIPEGLSVSVLHSFVGSGNISLTAAVAALGDKQFSLIGIPYSDTSNITTVETELASRFGARQNEGFAIYAKKDTVTDLSTLGNSKNSQFTTIVGYKGGLQDEAEWVAATVGAIIASAQTDPARPFQTLQLKGIVAPQSSDELKLSERETLLGDGIATYRVSQGGNVLIERLVTTFKTNAFGSADNSYMDLNTLLTLSQIRREVKAMTESKYPRHKLGNDGVNYTEGQPIITPNVYKAELVVLAASWVERGFIENIEAFKRDLLVQRNTTDPNRLDVLMPPDLVNQLRIVGVKIQFLLQGF